jgi:hypothetical protein
MKRALVLVAAALTACGGSQKITAEEARNAMPGTSQAQLTTPQGGNALTAAVAADAYTRADYAFETVALAASVNLGVAWPLGVLELVTALPPTSCAGDTCTWGPGSEATDLNDWQITVTKKDSSDYLWTMQGKSKSDPAAQWIAFVSGEAFTTGVRHVGHGTLVVDLDLAGGLARDPQEAKQIGKISATYDNTSGRHVSVQFVGTQDDKNPAQKVNAAYQFASTSTGGDLQVSIRNLSTGEKLQLHSRWTGVGAGRGDASFFDGVAQTYTRSQCWNGALTLFDMTYQVTDPVVTSGLNPDMGAESACVFATAELPTITVP